MYFPNYVSIFTPWAPFPLNHLNVSPNHILMIVWIFVNEARWIVLTLDGFYVRDLRFNFDLLQLVAGIYEEKVYILTIHIKNSFTPCNAAYQ